MGLNLNGLVMTDTPALRQRVAARTSACVAAAALGVWTGPALAAEGEATGPVPQAAPVTSAAAAQNFNVSAGALADALKALAAQANVSVAFDANQLQGLTTPGLQGSYTAVDALDRLLAPARLRAERHASGGYVVKASGANTNTSTTRTAGAGAFSSGVDNTLPTVTVSAASALDVTTEGTSSYAAPATSIFKGTQMLRDIPQPVTVVTRAEMDDRAQADLHDVLQTTPSISVDYVDSERVTYWSRGYQIDALQIDGLTFSQGGSTFIQPDTAVLDRVEVLRGASGMLRGAGNPSGAVNMARKLPTREFQAKANAMLGSWSRRRIEADVGGAFNQAGTLRGRMVLVADNKDFFQKAREEDRKVFYGVLQADLGPRTTLTGSYQYTSLDATGAWGNLPADIDGSPLNLPRDTYLGAAWNRWNRVNRQGYVALEHKFDNDWTVQAKAARLVMRMKGDYGFLQSYISRPASQTNPYLVNVTTSAYTGDKTTQDVAALVANGPFSLLGRKHELTLGLETQRNKVIGTQGYFNLGPMTSVDISTWDPYTTYPQPDIDPSAGTAYSAANNKTTQHGVYAATRLSITDPLHLWLGARLSWWDYKVPERASSNYSVDHEFTPYIGVTYDIAPALTAFASYTSIFSPQNSYDASGSLLKPVRGKNYELGLKGDFFDGKLQATASLFHINNVGKAVEDTSTANPCLPYYASGYCQMAGGKTRSRGVDLEVTGEVRPGWQVSGGYTYNRTKYVADSTASNVGQPLRSHDPKHQLRLFTTYRFGAGAMTGWTIGGGAQVQSDGHVTSRGLTARQGGYAVFNAMVGYRFNKQWALQLNVNNLFDKVYYKKYSPTGISNYYGDPRHVMLTLRASL
ncbi:TonB-dependent siderophore receptor [Ottowia sp.]|uniref:TonB-dependent siderophore receptor n=1 Tax=Ottowia sp. TaxID=1898956 RepID=UPI003A89EED4